MTCGPVDPRGPAVSQGFDFELFYFIIFLDFVSNFKNSYLELGMSILNEQNFVGFIMKCTI